MKFNIKKLADQFRRNIKWLAGVAVAGAAALALLFINEPQTQGQQVNTFTGAGTVTTLVQNQPAAATVVPFSTTWTNVIDASTAFGNLTPVDLRGLNGEVWLELTARADGAATGNIGLMIGSNLSGPVTGTNATSHTNINALRFVTVALNGTTQVILNTNLTALFGGAGKAPPFIFANYITNADGSGNVTNYTVRIYKR